MSVPVVKSAAKSVAKSVSNPAIARQLVFIDSRVAIGCWNMPQG